MTEAPATTRHALASWRRAIFSNVSRGVRARSGTDAVNLIVALVALGVVIIAFRTDSNFEKWWVSNVVPPPVGSSWVFTGLFFAGTFGAFGLLCVFAALHRRGDLGLDLLIGFALGFGASIAMQFFLGTSAGRPSDPAESTINVGFPVPILSAVIAAAIVGRPYFAQGVRRFFALAIATAFLGSMTTGRALPLALFGSLLVGWAASCAVRLWRGRPRVIADPEAVQAALVDYGLRDAQVSASEERNVHFGVDRIDARDEVGDVRVSVYSRDSRDAEVLRSTWRWITTRDTRSAPFVGRQQQAEHEALLTSTANVALGASAPSLLGVTSTAGGHDVLVLSRPVAATPLSARAELTLTDAEADQVVALVKRAHDAHVVLGALDLDHIGFNDAGAVVFTDAIDASINPTDNEYHRDVAATMVILALSTSVDASLARARATFGDEEIHNALSYLQRAALTPSLGKAAKAAGTLLVDLQTAGAKALGIEELKLVPLKRVSAATLVLAIGTLIGGWALLGVLVNVANSISTIKGADIPWVIATFFVAQVVFPSLAVADEGSVTGTLPYGRLVLLEISNTFSGLAMGTAGTMTARVRFLQRTGYDATIALSSGVLVSMVSWLVKGGLFLIALPFAWSQIHITTQPSSSGGHSGGVELVLMVIAGLGIALALVLFVPRWRRAAKDKLTPKYHETRDHLKTLAANPRKLVEIFGGNIGAQLIIAMALGCALHAFHTHLSMAELITVLTIGSAVGGLSPVPGGMGVVEAGMILSLTWFGVDQSVAVAAVFVQRLFTSYLPPIWGYATLLWLRKRDYL